MTWLKDGLDTIIGLAENAVKEPVEVGGRKYSFEGTSVIRK
jgi:hypothetical protein